MASFLSKTAESENVASSPTIKTFKVSRSNPGDDPGGNPPDGNKKPPPEPQKLPEIPKKPKLRFGRWKTPGGSGDNNPSDKGRNSGNGGSGNGRGDLNSHQRIDAKKPKMGGLIDRHCGKEAWVG